MSLSRAVCDVLIPASFEIFFGYKMLIFWSVFIAVLLFNSDEAKRLKPLDVSSTKFALLMIISPFLYRLRRVWLQFGAVL